MLSATAMEENHWPTQLDMPSEEEVAFSFSELMSSKARAKDSGVRKEANQVADEELQKELAFLSEQWRQQEVSNRIAGLKDCCASGAGGRIVARLKALRAMIKEEEGPEADISTESLRALQLFLQAAGNIRPPEITLTPAAEVYLRWKAGQDRLLAVHLVNDRMVRYTIFASNPRHTRLVRRLSGIEAADTVLETAKNVFPENPLPWHST